MLDMTSFLVCPRSRGTLVQQYAMLLCRKCTIEYPLWEDVPQFDLTDTTQADRENASPAGGTRDQRRSYGGLPREPSALATGSTQTFSEGQLKRLARNYNVSGLAIRKNGSPIEEFPRLGRYLMRFSAIRRLDRTLEPLLGSMLIMSFSKRAGLH